MDYVSLNNPNAESRIIAPYTFINTVLRRHLRAWCEKSKEFHDFVPSCFCGAPELETKTENTQEKDVAWNSQITVITPHLMIFSKPVYFHGFINHLLEK